MCPEECERGNGLIFFTLNGTFQGIAFKNVPLDNVLYPMIGAWRKGTIFPNFGEKEFVFDVSEFPRSILSRNGYGSKVDYVEERIKLTIISANSIMPGENTRASY